MGFIQDLHELINFAYGKGESGYFSPTTIDAQINSVQLDLFNEYISEGFKNRKFHKYLNPFRQSETINLVNGSKTLLKDYEYIRYVTNADDTIRVEVLDDQEWTDRVSSDHLPPEDSYPICKIEDKVVTVRPLTLKTVVVVSFRLPVEPVYGFDLVDDDYIYNDSKTTEIEWTKQVHARIRDRVLQNLGINLRDSTLIQFSEMKQQKEPE